MRGAPSRATARTLAPSARAGRRRRRRRSCPPPRVPLHVRRVRRGIAAADRDEQRDEPPHLVLEEAVADKLQLHERGGRRRRAQRALAAIDERGGARAHRAAIRRARALVGRAVAAEQREAHVRVPLDAHRVGVRTQSALASAVNARKSCAHERFRRGAHRVNVELRLAPAVAGPRLGDVDAHKVRSTSCRRSCRSRALGGRRLSTDSTRTSAAAAHSARRPSSPARARAPACPPAAPARDGDGDDLLHRGTPLSRRPAGTGPPSCPVTAWSAACRTVYTDGIGSSQWRCQPL